MRDYKKIYDELFEIIQSEGNNYDYITHLVYEEEYSEWLFGKYTEKDKLRKAELTQLLHNLYNDTPKQEVCDLFEYIAQSADYHQTDIGGHFILKSYEIPDEQIEAVCKKYAYLEWWAKTIYCLLLCEHKGKPLSTIYQVQFNESYVNNIIDLFEYYHKTIIPRKVLSELSNTPDQQEQQTPIKPSLPPKLSTPEAMVYWKKAQKAGLVDDNYKFVEGITQQSKVYFIHRLCTMLGHGNTWAGLKPFTGMDNQQMADVFSKIPYESNPDNKIFNYADIINELFDY